MRLVGKFNKTGKSNTKAGRNIPKKQAQDEHIYAKTRPNWVFQFSRMKQQKCHKISKRSNAKNRNL